MQNKGAYLLGFLGRVGPALIQLVANMIMARFLSPDDFGTIGVLAIIIMVANVLVDSGLGGSLVKEKDITNLDCSTIAFFNIIMGVVIYLVLFIFAPLIERIYGINNLSIIVRVLSTTFLIGPIGLVPKALLYRSLQFGKVTATLIISILFASVIAVIMAMNGAGVWSLVAFQIVNSIMIVVTSCFACHYKLSFRFSKSSFNRLFSFGFITTIISIVDTIYENLLTTITGKYLSVGEAGYLTQSKKLEESLTTSVASTIGNVAFPILTKLKNDNERFIKEASSVYETLSLISFPILLYVAFFADEIITLLFGEKWLPSAFYLKALIFAGILIILETLIRSFIKSLCEVELLMKATVIKRVLGIIIILIAAIVASRMLVYAYILSSLIAFLINAFVYCNLTHQKIGSFLFTTIKVIIPSVLCYLVLSFFKYGLEKSLWIQLILAILLLLVYYSILLPKYGINILDMFRGHEKEIK